MHLRQLQSILNAAARLIARKRKSDSISFNNNEFSQHFFAVDSGVPQATWEKLADKFGYRGDQLIIC